MRKSRTIPIECQGARCAHAQERHTKTNYQQEKSLPTIVGRSQEWEEEYIHAPASQNRDVSTNKTLILRH